MTTPLRITTADVDFTAVGEAWNQANLDNFAFRKIPSVEVLGFEDGYSGLTTYDLVDLAYALNQGGGSALWKPGTDPGTGEDIPTTSVSLRLQGKRSPVKARNLASKRSRIADLRKPWDTLLSNLATGMEYDFSNFLRNTSVFGSAQTFTGSALSTIDVANQDPIGDIETAMNGSVRLTAFGTGRFRTTAIMDTKTLDVLRRRPEYTGAGEGSNSSGAMPQDAFIDRFKATHRIQDVIVIATAINSAAAGATKTVNAHTPILWIGNIDSQAFGASLSGGNRDVESNPDGALVLATDMYGFIHRFKEDGLLGLENHMITAEYAFYSPRGSTMAVFWTGSDISA